MVRLTALQIYAEDNGHNMNMTVLNQQNNKSPHTMIALNSLKNNLDKLKQTTIIFLQARYM